ncbi:MAG: GerAB/ArcD/ProY family transporter [Firmicutes bacterium]|nr:GerAB/ArcD/ProY family transporter [Bacillota bacterium]
MKTSQQAIFIIIFVNIATSVLFIPSEEASFLGQNAWVAVVLGTFLAALFAYYPLADLGMRYPGQKFFNIASL